MAKPMTPEERLARSTQLGIIVDEQDIWLLSAFTWSLHHKGHVITNVQQTNIWDGSRIAFLHHYIVGMPIRRSIVVDHIDRNPQNNRRSNLRYATKSANRYNSKSWTIDEYRQYLRDTGRVHPRAHRV